MSVVIHCFLYNNIQTYHNLDDPLVEPPPAFELLDLLEITGLSVALGFPLLPSPPPPPKAGMLLLPPSVTISI